MSRMLGFCFLLGDAAATVATFLSSASISLVVFFSVLTSIALAAMSSSIRSILWPTYFWDEEGGQ